MPESEITPVLVIVTLEPKLTDPPPDKPLPAVTVTDEFARLALEMAAVPERLALDNPEIVFEAAEIVLLVKVSVVALPTSVSVASGKVSVRATVGVQVSVPLLSKVTWLEVLERVIAEKVGVALVPIFWIVLTTPEETLKLEELNWEIPF